MDYGQAAFVVLFASSSFAAIFRGDRYARWAGALSIGAALATRAVVQSQYAETENGVFLIDVGLAIGFALLTKYSRTGWLAGCAILQILTVLTHLARMTLAGVESVAYFDATGFWSFPIMFLILFASGRPTKQSGDILVPARRQQTKSTERLQDRTEEVWLLRDLLAAGSSGIATEAWAAQVLGRLGGIGRILSAPVEVLKREGISERTIEFLRLCRRTTQHVTRARIDERLQLISAQEVVDYLRAEIGSLHREQFRILYFNNRHALINDEVHCIGTLDHVPAYPRHILAEALKLNAATLILAHNHPSGDCTPSSADTEVTKQICRVLRPFQIHVKDHLIVSEFAWTSLRLEGLLNEVQLGFIPTSC